MKQRGGVDGVAEAEIPIPAIVGGAEGDIGGGGEIGGAAKVRRGDVGAVYREDEHPLMRRADMRRQMGEAPAEIFGGLGDQRRLEFREQIRHRIPCVGRIEIGDQFRGSKRTKPAKQVKQKCAMHRGGLIGREDRREARLHFAGGGKFGDHRDCHLLDRHAGNNSRAGGIFKRLSLYSWPKRMSGDTTLRGESPSVSIIIPIWNDAEQLRSLLDVMRDVTGILEVIIGDASDTGECRAIAEAAGARVVSCAEPSRGKQMNAAAALARGDVLLFQHADTELSQAHIDSLRATMRDPMIVGGGFYRRFNPHHRTRRWMEPIIRRINRYSTIWGDQSMFMRREHFESLGGFAPIPLFEDADLSRRLRRSGKVKLIDPPMHSSARRHKAYGSWRASAEIFVVCQLYRIGVSPFWLHRQYYRLKKKGRQGPPVETEVGPHRKPAI